MRLPVVDFDKRVLADTLKMAIPGKQHIRQVLRRTRPYETDSAKDTDLFNDTVRQIRHLRDAGHDIRGERILEIGSGFLLPLRASAIVGWFAAFIFDGRHARSYPR